MSAPTTRIAQLGLLAMILAAGACATGLRTPQYGTPRRSGVETGEELQRCVGLSLYACLERDRPAFVNHSTGSVTVFVDGVLWGPVAKLRDIPAVEVREVRLLTRVEATTLHGSMPGGPALEVVLRRSVPRR